MCDKQQNTTMGKSEALPSTIASNARKTKRRPLQKPLRLNWNYEAQSEEMPVPECSPVFYHQPNALPPHFHQGQRLFTAMSDPSVCGYSPVPMTYAMEPVSIPSVYPLYRPVPQPNYTTLGAKPRWNKHVHPSVHNGYCSLQERQTHCLSPNSDHNDGEYASLPPTANNEARSEINEVGSEHRRYSDPGLGPADCQRCEESDSATSDTSVTIVGKTNKMVLMLVGQMTDLKKANSCMFKELQDTKLSLENTQSELTRIKLQANFEYQPGMLSDIIGELREANKTLEDTVFARIVAIIEDKNHQRLSELQDVEQRLVKMTEEKIAADKRIIKLEEEVAKLKISVKNEGEIAAFEEETLALRRELQEARSSSANRHQSSDSTKLEKLVDCVRKKVIIIPDDNEGLLTTASLGDVLEESDEDDEFQDYSVGDEAISRTRLMGPVTDL